MAGPLERLAGAVSSLAGPREPQAAVERARDLADTGFRLSLERSGGDDPMRALADVELAMALLASEGLAPIAEVLVVPEWCGGAAALARLTAIGRDTGVAVMIGLGPGSDLAAHLELRSTLVGEDGVVGLTLPTCVRSIERMCSEITGQVRLTRGNATYGTTSVQRYGQPLEVDKALVRCARVLLSRAARGEDVRVSIATHDGRLVDIVRAIAARERLAGDAVEFAMQAGLPGGLRERIVAGGGVVRAIVPFGPAASERLASGLLERPGGIASAIRQVLG